MTNKNLFLPHAIHEYILNYSLKEDRMLERLRLENIAHPLAHMQISPEQGQLISFLIKLTQAKLCLEVGVFFGYSGLWIALALPEDGKLIACEKNPEFAQNAQQSWKEAGVQDKTSLKFGDAQDTMKDLLKQGFAEKFDFIFVDADKLNYLNYYELALKLVRHGGLICFDNLLWQGKVTTPPFKDESTAAIHKLNETLHKDARIDFCLTPIADGFGIVRKK